jgi:Rrf2 family transcriptional regulator, iron-sulfur cluster assembly transcription factor
MKLTTRGHYSVKALLDLSLQPGYGPASVRMIADRQCLPAPYLEKLLIELRRAGLVISLRGAQGGYRLARCRSRSIPSLSMFQTIARRRIGLPLPSGTDLLRSSRNRSTPSLWRTSTTMRGAIRRPRGKSKILWSRNGSTGDRSNRTIAMLRV